MNVESTAQHTTPCAECPFARHVKPGTLGGSPVLTYVGQVNGPFWLPCHEHTDYNDPNWKTDHSKPQCAGAAIFRSNIGKARGGAILALPENHRLVFSTFAEFVAHHRECAVRWAKELLEISTPEALTQTEMLRAGTTVRLVPVLRQVSVRRCGNIVDANPSETVLLKQETKDDL